MTKIAKTVTNIFKLSPPHFVSNIRHQHRCSQIRVLKLAVCLHVFGKSGCCRFYVGKSNVKLEISYQVLPTVFRSFEIERKLSNFKPSIKTFKLIFRNIKWGASSRWSFDPNSAWGSIGTMTIGKTHSSLYSMICRSLYHYLMFASAGQNLLAIYLQFAFNLLAICLQSACNLFAICLQSACNQLAICLQSACNLFAICLQFACDQLAIC